MINIDTPWNLEFHFGHGAGGGRWVVCDPDYEHRVAIISLNGAPQSDEDIAKQYAVLIQSVPNLLRACRAAASALRSYQFGNDSPELAESVAEYLEIEIAKAKGK